MKRMLKAHFSSLSKVFFFILVPLNSWIDFISEFGSGPGVSFGAFFHGCFADGDCLSDMGVVELGHVARLHVQTPLLCCFKLVFINVSILIANRSWVGSEGRELAQRNHLWPQVIESLLVSFFKQLSRGWSEETAFVENSHVRLQLLDCEVSQACHQDRFEICVLEVPFLDVVSSTLIHNVDQVELDYVVHVDGENVVFLLHSRSFRFAHLSKDFHEKIGCSCRQCFLQMVGVQEISDACSG